MNCAGRCWIGWARICGAEVKPRAPGCRRCGAAGYGGVSPRRVRVPARFAGDGFQPRGGAGFSPRGFCGRQEASPPPRPGVAAAARRSLAVSSGRLDRLTGPGYSCAPRERDSVGDPVPWRAPNGCTNATAWRFHAGALFLMNVESNFIADGKWLIRDELASRALLLGFGDHSEGRAGGACQRNILPRDARLTPFAHPPLAGTVPLCGLDKVMAVKPAPCAAKGRPQAPPRPAGCAAGDCSLKRDEPVTAGWWVEVE